MTGKKNTIRDGLGGYRKDPFRFSEMSKTKAAVLMAGLIIGNTSASLIGAEIREDNHGHESFVEAIGITVTADIIGIAIATGFTIGADELLRRRDGSESQPQVLEQSSEQ